MITFLINKIIQFWNILKALPFLALFYIYVNIGYYYYSKSNDDKIRVKYTDIFYGLLFKGLKLGISNQIIYLNNLKINLEKVSIINSNHVHQNDIFILFNLFDRNNIKGSNMSSISTSKGIGDFDKKILKLSSSAMVNNSKDDINQIINQFIIGIIETIILQ